jgi:hypothetical protein
MKAYLVRPPMPTQIDINDSYEGETIEERVQRIMNNREPITDGAPEIYTERKDGVRPEHNIRTDRFELATDAMDRISKERVTKREEFHKKLDEDNKKINPETGNNTYDKQ